jgi:hypothetical protein
MVKEKWPFRLDTASAVLLSSRAVAPVSFDLCGVDLAVVSYSWWYRSANEGAIALA